MQLTPNQELWLDEPIWMMNIGSRLAGVLEKHHIVLVRNLLECCPGTKPCECCRLGGKCSVKIRLLDLPYVGLTELKNIYSALAEIGFIVQEPTKTVPGKKSQAFNR